MRKLHVYKINRPLNNFISFSFHQGNKTLVNQNFEQKSQHIVTDIAFFVVFQSKMRLLLNYQSTLTTIQQMLKMLKRQLSTWRHVVSCLREAYWAMKKVQLIKALFCKTCQMSMHSLLVGLTMLGRKVKFGGFSLFIIIIYLFPFII